MIETDVATTLLRAGRVEEALEDGRRILQGNPAAPRGHSVLGWALIFHREKAAGIAEMENAARLAPDSTLFLSQLGEAYGLCGKLEQARQVLEGLRECAKRDFVSPYHFAYVHAGLGEPDAAMPEDW